MIQLKKIAGYIFPFILMIVFLYLAFKNIDFDQVFSILKEISVSWLIAYIFIWFISHLVRAYRWKIIIKSVKENTRIENLFTATMVGYGVNCVIPRLGELYRGLFLGKWEDISRSSMVGTIVLERIIDILVLGISVLISVLIYSGDLYKDIDWLKSTLYLGFVAIFLLIVFLVVLVKFKDRFINVLVKITSKFSAKISDLLSRIFHLIIEGFSSIKGPKKYLQVGLFSAIIMSLYGLTAYIGFYIIHMDKLANVTYSMAWIVMTISAFGVIIPTPGATGSYHLIVIFVLVNLFGFDEEISGAYAILTHAITYILFIFSTIVLTYFINRKQKKEGLAVANFISVFKTKESLN